MKLSRVLRPIVWPLATVFMVGVVSGLFVGAFGSDGDVVALASPTPSASSTDPDREGRDAQETSATDPEPSPSPTASVPPTPDASGPPPTLSPTPIPSPTGSDSCTETASVLLVKVEGGGGSVNALGLPEDLPRLSVPIDNGSNAVPADAVERIEDAVAGKDHVIFWIEGVDQFGDSQIANLVGAAKGDGRVLYAFTSTEGEGWREAFTGLSYKVKVISGDEADRTRAVKDWVKKELGGWCE